MPVLWAGAPPNLSVGAEHSFNNPDLFVYKPFIASLFSSALPLYLGDVADLVCRGRFGSNKRVVGVTIRASTSLWHTFT